MEIWETGRAGIYRLASWYSTESPFRGGGGRGGGHSSSGGSSSSHSSGGFSSHSSSGFSSGSSGSSSGSIGGLIALVVFFGIAGVVIYIIWKAIKRSGGGGFGGGTGMPMPPFPPGTGGGGAGTGESGPMQGRAATQAEIAGGVEAIKQHDPGFSIDNMLGQTNQAFFAVQEAWTERKPELSRAVMADGCWAQHRMQINQYVQSNRSNRLDNLAVQNIYPVGVSTDGNTDTVIVRIFASSADYDVDLSNNKVISGHRDIEDWSEDWIFQRKAGATTRADGGTLSKKCPNCGAPLDLAMDGTCSYCKAPVMSGELDWVLGRIDQIPSWEWGQATLPR